MCCDDKRCKHDEILTFGYVNCCYRLKELKTVQQVPINIIQMIGHWVYYEKIHLIPLVQDKDMAKHFAIDVDVVIGSTLNLTKM